VRKASVSRRALLSATKDCASGEARWEISFLEILAGMVAVGVVAACMGFFKDKFPEAWRYIFSAAVFFGGLWLASEGEYETVRWMAFFLPLVLVFAMVMFWKLKDDEKRR
jgi:uncharacterized membrane protein